MIRVYLFDMLIPDNHPDRSARLNEYSSAFTRWYVELGDRMKINMESDDQFALWLEFDTEEEAALFKLSEL